MTVERPQHISKISTYRLFEVPPSAGVPGGTIKQLFPEKDAFANGYCAKDKTLGVPSRNKKLALNEAGGVRQIVNVNPVNL